MSRALLRQASRFAREHRAAAALEFALVAAPFFFLVLGILQMSVYYLTQSALDSGVLQTAETLRANYAPGTTIPTPSGTVLKTNISQFAGAMIPNNSTVLVDLWQMNKLASAGQPVIDQHVDSVTTGVMVLRAQTTAINFAPIFLGATLTVRSSAILRGGT
jgi:Flp pilus assembly protein TadG